MLSWNQCVVANCSLNILLLICGIAWWMSVFLVSFVVRLRTHGKLWPTNGEPEVIDALLMQWGPAWAFVTSLDAATMEVMCSRCCCGKDWNTCAQLCVHEKHSFGFGKSLRFQFVSVVKPDLFWLMLCVCLTPFFTTDQDDIYSLKTPLSHNQFHLGQHGLYNSILFKALSALWERDFPVRQVSILSRWLQWGQIWISEVKINWLWEQSGW